MRLQVLANLLSAALNLWQGCDAAEEQTLNLVTKAEQSRDRPPAQLEGKYGEEISTEDLRQGRGVQSGRISALCTVSLGGSDHRTHRRATNCVGWSSVNVI